MLRKLSLAVKQLSHAQPRGRLPRVGMGKLARARAALQRAEEWAPGPGRAERGPKTGREFAAGAGGAADLQEVLRLLVGLYAPGENYDFFTNFPESLFKSLYIPVFSIVKRQHVFTYFSRIAV